MLDELPIDRCYLAAMIFWRSEPDEIVTRANR